MGLVLTWTFWLFLRQRSHIIFPQSPWFRVVTTKYRYGLVFNAAICGDTGRTPHAVYQARISLGFLSSYLRC